MINRHVPERPAGIGVDGHQPNRRPPLRLCLVADRTDWAFAHIAHQVKRHLGDTFVVDTEYICQHEDQRALLCHLFTGEKRYDLIHFLWRGMLLHLFSPRELAWTVQAMRDSDIEVFLRNIAHTVKSTSVYDHLFLDDSEYAVLVNQALSHVDAYSVSSNTLHRIYSNMPSVPPPSCVLTDGVDLNMFFPPSVDDDDARDQSVCIGWAGNSSWGEPGTDHKGLKTIIEPAIARMQAEGLPVRGDFRDRANRFVPHADMPDYYRKLDLYVCASLHEGTPNPLLEAMATGLPILTTDIGIAREALGPRQQEFIVGDRQHPEFYIKLRQLVRDRALRKQLSRENLGRVQAWNWPERAAAWRHFFENTHAAAQGTRPRIAQYVMLHQMLAAGKQILHLDALRGQTAHLLQHTRHQLLHTESLLAHAQGTLNTRCHRSMASFCRWIDRLRGRRVPPDHPA